MSQKTAGARFRDRERGLRRGQLPNDDCFQIFAAGGKNRVRQLSANDRVRLRQDFRRCDHRRSTSPMRAQ